jgi:hypothetical protein
MKKKLHLKTQGCNGRMKYMLYVTGCYEDFCRIEDDIGMSVLIKYMPICEEVFT